MSQSKPEFKIRRNGDQILYQSCDGDGAIPVRLAWLRPLTASGGPVTIMHADKKQELVMLDGFDHLDEKSRQIIADELKSRYFLPKITKVHETSATFGNRYWHVETDCGPKRFLMKSPETNATWITDDRCLLRDALGNCYEIESFKGLDRASRLLADNVL